MRLFHKLVMHFLFTICISPWDSPTSKMIFLNLHTFRSAFCVTQLNAAAAAKSLQSCLTLCDPIDDSPPGSPIPGILQARVLEWGAIAFSGHSWIGFDKCIMSWTQNYSTTQINSMALKFPFHLLRLILFLPWAAYFLCFCIWMSGNWNQYVAFSYWLVPQSLFGTW